MARYRNEFFRDRHASTVYAAESVLRVLQPALPPLRSAIDVGCGVGTWLSVLAANGVAEVQGVDGPWVKLENLVIPRGSFRHHDLADKRFKGQIAVR
jgi:2-polyprenyl-3-methyl-5-hydroxy-6-metoxy-1,4-benzoquinol methylase